MRRPNSSSHPLCGGCLTTIGPYNPPLSYSNPFPKPPVGPPTPTFTINLDNRNPYALEWNFGVEQLLPRDWKLSVNYVGAGGRHLVLVTEENVAVIGPGPIADRRPVHNTGSIGNRENTGNSNYNSLQAKVEKNLTSSLTFLNSFTWSRSLDIHSDANSNSIQYTYNKRLSYGPSDFNVPLINVTSFVYYLPVGRGKAFGSSLPRALDLLLGGWQTSGIVTLRSGLPFSIYSGIDNANIGSTSNVMLGDIVKTPVPSGFDQNRAHWFDTSAFKTPALNTIGTSSRNMMRGPSYQNVDFSAMTNFMFTEQLRLQFRAEMFNLFNHTNFGTPANRLTDPNFGAILSALPSRDVQFGLKLLW